jgi:hypothetical protein
VSTSHGWCSLRLRFDERELTLLRGAEQVRGVGLAHAPKPDQLRTALKLAKAGHKLGQAQAGTSISLEEAELSLLLDAVRYGMAEIQWAARPSDGQDTRRRAAVLSAFPELADQAWRTFAVAREMESLAARLQGALTS